MYGMLHIFHSHRNDTRFYLNYIVYHNVLTTVKKKGVEFLGQ
jgi:hypothetical protein